MIASSFNRLHLIIDVGTALPEKLCPNVVDRVAKPCGRPSYLTVQCASCHDHKFDPITTKDFYQLFAFFNNFLMGSLKQAGVAVWIFRRGLQAYIDLPSASVCDTI